MRGIPLSSTERALIVQLYPDTPTKEIAARLGCTVGRVYRAADRLGLKKSVAYMASPAAYRFRRDHHAGWEHRFQKGQIPANKGLRRPGWAPGRMKETQFKSGNRTGKAAENWCQVGTIRTDAEGYQRIKVRDARPGENYGFGNTKVWPLLNRHVWEQAHGPIPPGHNVVFADGNRQNCALDNLELVSRQDMMRRNTVHRMPKELADLIQLRGALNRKIRSLDAKQNDRPA